MDLQELVDNGEPFKTCWLGSKKELCSWAMERSLVGGPISITLNQWMDEDEALVYDALPDDVQLSDEQMEEILDVWSGSDGVSQTSEVAVVPGDSSLDTILERVSDLFDQTDAALKEQFDLMKEIVQGYLDQ